MFVGKYKEVSALTKRKIHNYLFVKIVSNCVFLVCVRACACVFIYLCVATCGLSIHN